MDNTIIVELDPFVMESKISIYTDGDKEITKVHGELNVLAQDITNMSYARNIYDIKVRAPLVFQSELSKRIKCTEHLLYSASNINVEGI